MRKSYRKKDNIRWNSELASLRKEARQAWKKALKTKQEEDWEAQKLALSYFKKAVRKSKRDSWHSFVESMNCQTPTARLVKIIRRNEIRRVSNVIKHNVEFTKSPLETLNYLLDILSPGSQQIENHASRSDLVDSPYMRPEDTEMIANISSFERMKAAGPAREGFRGYIVPRHGPRGPGRVQVSALIFGVAPSGVFMGLNLSKDFFLLFT